MVQQIVEGLLSKGKIYSASTVLANSVDDLSTDEFNRLNKKIKHFPVPKGKCETVTSSGRKVGCHNLRGHGHQ